MRPVMAVNLRSLFPTASFVGCADLRVTEAFSESGVVQPGGLFAALPGTRGHGIRYLPEAMTRGAMSLLTERAVPECQLPQCVVRDVRVAFGRLCHALYRDPSRTLNLAGITGTNGKTTTTYMIRAILEAAGHPTGLSGTIEIDDGEQAISSRLTTPGCRELAEWAAKLRRAGYRHAAMEVSSHALDQGRLAGMQLDVALVTNLTQDHFDYHGDIEAYRAAKAQIFGHIRPGGVAILNADDPGAMSFEPAAGSAARMVTFGFDERADVRARMLDTTVNGSVFEVTANDKTATLRTPLIGRHNVSNALAAIAVCRTFGIELSDMERGLAALTSVPGRMQRIATSEPFAAWVDYAHTDDGLRRAIAAVRPLIAGRLILVFGAGGDRDPIKRPLMGVAAASADLVFVTSDNPRSEAPEAIVRDILSGWPTATALPQVVLDREAAIFAAVASAQPGDGVLIAGKGHEAYQQIGSEKRPFCDRETCRRAIDAHPSTMGCPAPHLFQPINGTTPALLSPRG